MLKNKRASAHRFFSEISHAPLPAVIDRQKKKFSYSFIIYVNFLSQNDKNNLPLEREIIQKEIETKIKLLAFILFYFFFMNINVNVTNTFFFQEYRVTCWLR